MPHQAHPPVELKVRTDLHEVLVPSNEPWQVDLKAPAMEVMTDFRVRAMFTIDQEITIDEALDKMKIAGLRIAFVKDKASEKLVGMITSYDIMGEKPMRFLQSVGFGDSHITHKDIKVKDIMDTVETWAVADIADVEKMNVKTVLEALQKVGKTHLPVVESKDGHTRLRGLFSSAKILRLTEFSRKQAATKA